MVKKFFTIIILVSSISFAQYNGNKFMIGVNAVYTTSAKIFLYPNSSDVVLRNTSFPLQDIFNHGMYFKYKLSDDIILGLNTEIMTKTAVGPNLTVFSGNRTVTINVTDGFKLIPIELSIYYLLPFSMERYKFLMGGGVAYYYGKHIRNFGDAGVSSTETHIAYGIHVSVSMDYLLTDKIILHGGMKFRDPQFTVENTYTKKIVNYNGSSLDLAQDSFVSKINVDGVAFDLGLAYSF
ncbi:MAG: hypothetical protein M1480_16340 [Bacteroidetes bacterium]|nr:hypothetical protein [Bacteroidota bacterium]